MTDELIFGVVVLARLGVPLLIARYPLPAIVACLVIDAVDQTIFQQFTDLNLDDYQSYDKALDIYYLTMAYVSTIRNWGGGPDFVVGRFLWYYRLAGVAVFEFTSERWLLLVFANTFEYYFIALELFKLRRNPNTLSLRTVVLIAGFIWVFIKLPQEWWIHVAQLDVTDEVKERLFGVDPDSGWWAAISNRPWVAVAIVVAALLAAWCLSLLARRLPPPLWPRTFDADRQGEFIGWKPPRKEARPGAAFGWPFVEKCVLVSLVAFILARILPGADTRLTTMVIVTTYLIAANTIVSQFLARRDTTWRSTLVEFSVMLLVNVAIVLVTAVIIGRGSGGTPLGGSLFLVAVLTLIVVLYDRSRGIDADQQARARSTIGEGRVVEAPT